MIALIAMIMIVVVAYFGGTGRKVKSSVKYERHGSRVLSLVFRTEEERYW